MTTPWRRRRRRPTGDDDRREDRREKTPAPPQAYGREARALEEARRVARLGADIEGYFSQRVLRLTGEIQKRLGVGTNRSDPRHAFPSPPGAHLPARLRGSPALAFVKTACAVFSLDKSVEGPVALLRKNALRLLRVPEYAPEAKFREPCVTFVLRDVVCGYCGDCRDLDLCRDERLVGG